MLGRFWKKEIRQLPPEKRRARYLQIFLASVGNHSVSLYYCVWSQEEFEAALSPGFQKEIRAARAQMADRTTFILHRALGLIKDEKGGLAPATNAQALAKVVDKLSDASSAYDDAGGDDGFKLVVKGLDRTATPPGPPPTIPPTIPPAAADIFSHLP